VSLIGEAGLGKSTLLQKTYRDLGRNFIGATTSDPRLGFTGILRLILRRAVWLCEVGPRYVYAVPPFSSHKKVFSSLRGSVSLGKLLS
jgi:hypothetical protein